MIKLWYNREDFRNFVKGFKTTHRIANGINKNQTSLTEFICNQPESKAHKEAKRRIAKMLEEDGKAVFLEKKLNINGINFRADICFLEDGKWNIIEVEYGNDKQNTIFRNYDILSKIVNIKIADARNPDVKIEDVERYLEVKKQIRGI